MKTSFIVAAVLAAAANFGAASPIEGSALDERTIEIRGSTDVGFGQQIRLSDQKNMWVVWEHEKNACPNQKYLTGLSNSPCGIKFKLLGYDKTVQLCDCNSANKPTSLCDSNGKRIKSCKTKDHKMGCPNGQHDIVQHGYCK